MFGSKKQTPEERPTADPRFRSGLYGMAALYLVYLLYQIARPYLTGDAVYGGAVPLRRGGEPGGRPRELNEAPLWTGGAGARNRLESRCFQPWT